MQAQTTLDFLRALYPAPFAELAGGLPARLVVWTKRGRGSFSLWCDSVEEAAHEAERLRHRRDVYFGVALQDFQAALAAARAGRGLDADPPPSTVRGTADTALVVPGLWVDLDVAGANHKSADLPPDLASALTLLKAIELRASCIVRTGGGCHVYWLFDQPWVLVSSADRAAARELVARLQAAIRERARKLGWGVDETSDLPRVLRLPGTFNHKSGTPAAIEIELLDPTRRYSVDDFERLLPQLVEGGGSAAGNGGGDGGDGEGEVAAGPREAAGREADKPSWDHLGPADFRGIFRGCSFVRWCCEKPEEVGYPLWYALLTIAVRCLLRGVHRLLKGAGDADGRELAHLVSRGHPRYTRAETERKIRQALKPGAGPYPCSKIAAHGALEDHCSRCPHWRKIASPIVLGRWWHSDSGAAGGGGRSRRRGNGRRGNGRRGNGGGKRRGKVPIHLSHHEEQVADAVLAAVVEREKNLFERGGTLVQVVAGDGDEVPFHRPPEAAAARQVPEARLREIIVSHCECRSRSNGRPVKGRGAKGHGTGERWRPVHPPQWLVRALLGRFRWQGLPRLEGIVEGPVLRPDGSILARPGYDRASGLYHAPGERLDPIPARPSDAQVEAALERLREAVCDFPFAGEAHFSGWLASLLTPLARFAFRGPSPLNLIDANIRGAGKTLLADVTNLIVTGRPAAHMAYLRDEVELRKVITSIALKGRQTVLFDNVWGPFGSPTLDLALTSASWEDRLLGQNLDLELPLLVTWYVTGNNIALKGDLGRRCLHIRLDSPEEKPEHRAGFRHPRLLEWIAGERRRLLPAALTLLAGFVGDGRPSQGLKPWGAYESWSELIRGTIVWLGQPDPIETCAGLESTADGELLAAGNLVAALAELLVERGGGATAGEILETLEAGKKEGRHQDLQAAVEELFPRLKRGELPTPVQLGNRLRALRGRNFGGLAVDGQRSRRGVVWTVARRLANGELPFGEESRE